MHINDFDLPRFQLLLEQLDAEILSPTNEWEVLRYKLLGKTSIVYKNRKGRLRFTGDSEQHYYQHIYPTSPRTQKEPN